MCKNQKFAACAAGAVLCAALYSVPAMGQVMFTNVAGDRGIDPYSMMQGLGGGLAAADFDNDGDVDVFVPNGFGVADQLYVNQGDGTFQDQAAARGVASYEAHRTGLFFDYDADGLLDLVTTGGDCWDARCEPDWIPLRMYRQLESGSFDDVTGLTGIGIPSLPDQAPHVSGLCAGDINNDGYLDLIIGLWSDFSYLFLNNQDGTFTDISDSSGIRASNHFWQSVMLDIDDDGWLDIYVAVDYTENHLFINQHDNTFIDIAAAAGADVVMNDMGVAVGDYDNDGDFDLYSTNIWDFTGEGEHNVLLRNDTVDGLVSFTDVSYSMGVAQGFWGWGTTFFDCNNDGWLDLAATNGFSYGDWLTDTSRFFLNTLDVTESFTEVGGDVGFSDEDWGSSLIAFDYDEDGDLDMMQTCNLGGPLRLLENQIASTEGEHHFLNVRPRMTGANHQAIGTVVRATVGDLQLMRLITAGISFMGQEPAEAFFGLGDAQVIDQLTIDWPDGSQSQWTNVPADRLITLFPEGIAGDLNADTVVGPADLALLLGAWGSCPRGEDCPGDLSGDGSVGPADLAQLLGTWG